MLRRIGILFAVVVLCGADDFLKMLKKDWEMINYSDSITQKGSNISVGFIDSAFNLSHPSLDRKNGITDEYSSNILSDYERDAFTSSHGTHVAGIAIGNYLDDEKIHGIAPKAGFYGVSYLNPNYSYGGSKNDIVNFFVKSGVKIINNSWSRTYFPFINKEMDDAKQVIEYAYKQLTSSVTPQFVLNKANEDIGLQATIELAKKGILQVYSTGNQGQLSPSINASLPTYDESLKAWISVSAFDTDYITKNGDNFTFKAQMYDSQTKDYRGGFTSFANAFLGSQSYGIIAPGYNIGSANAYYESEKTKNWGGSIYPCLNYQFCPLSGTSQAAPFVSGAAALVAEKYLFADGRLLADILLSTANSNVSLPKIIIKKSPVEWGTESKPSEKHYYYNIIYTENVNYLNDQAKIKEDLMRELQIDDAQAQEILTHLMYNENGIFAKYMTKEDLIGQGILDIDKALKGLSKLDANRLLESDIKGEQAFYTIDTKGYNGTFENDISQVKWNSAWHINNSKLANIDKIGLIKTGNGILTLSGQNNTYSGDTIASGGILKLTGILENSSVFAQNGGTFNLAGNVKNNVTALNNGRILLSNAATIGKSLNSQNSGIIEIENGASATINGGVNNAGILKGAGTIVGSVTNEGTIMSGFYNEIDDISGNEKLNIQGDFAQSLPSAKLQIAFLKDGTNTDFSATNYAITGGILEYIPLQNSTNYIKPDDKIKIAINENLTNELDKFTNIQVKSTNILEFQVDSKDKTLLNAKVKANAFDNANTELSNVLKEMFGRNISPQYDAAFAAIGQMSPAQYQSTMDSIAATPTKQSLHTIDSTQKTLGLKNTLFMIDPFDNIGDLNPSSVVFEPTAALGDAHLQNISDVYVKTKLSAGITYKKMKHDDYDQTSYLFDIQGKKEIDESSKLGGFIGLVHSKTENDNSKLKSNLFSLGASYERDFGAFSALGGLSAGMSFNNLDQSIRNLANSDTSAKYKNYFLTVQAGIYRGIALSQNTQIAPLAMLEYNFIHQESFSQNGGVFAREFDAKNSSFARLWAGANFSHKWMLNDFEMTGSLYAFYWHRFDSKQSEDLSFSVARDLKFSNHFSAEQNGFYGGVSLQARRKNVFFKASFSDEKASAYNQYEIMLRAGMNF